jgi:hypothetical protein
MTTQGLPDLLTAPERQPEVHGPGHRVRVVKHIRANPHRDQAPHERPHDGTFIVAPLEKNALAAERDSGIRQTTAGGNRGRRDLTGVIEVPVDEQRPKTLQEK